MNSVKLPVLSMARVSRTIRSLPYANSSSSSRSFPAASVTKVPMTATLVYVRCTFLRTIEAAACRSDSRSS